MVAGILNLFRNDPTHKRALRVIVSANLDDVVGLLSTSHFLFSSAIPAIFLYNLLPEASVAIIRLGLTMNSYVPTSVEGLVRELFFMARHSFHIEVVGILTLFSR